MGLMLADHDLDVEPDDLLEDLVGLCSCACGPATHDADTGCQACTSCSALGLRGIAGEEDDELEVDVARVCAFLKAARAHRRKIEQDRADAIAKDPTRSPRANKPRVATTKAVAPRTATTKPKAPAMLPPAADEDDGRIHFEEDVLETVLAG